MKWYNMGKTNRLSHLSPGQGFWPSTLLPFFDWFIRRGGFENWWDSLRGTQKEREEHPFLWTYDDVSETVWYEDRWIENGHVVEQVVTATMPSALQELLAHQVDSALSVIRTCASRSDRVDSLLTLYLSETESLRKVSVAHPMLSLQPSVEQALMELEEGVRLMGSPKLKKPKRTKKGTGVHQQNRSWIIEEYADQRTRLPDQSEYDAREEVAERYAQEFSTPINESSIRRMLNQK